MHVSIVGLGPSSAVYVSICKRLGDRCKYSDQTWVINGFGGVLAHDLIFHMDDVRVQMIRAAAAPDSNIAAMLKWLKKPLSPVMTSREHPDFPALTAFPLEAIVNEFPQCYFNSTAAYAVAYAIHKRVTKLSLFGMDFTYPDAHDAEKGRACVEFWLGIAVARGIKLAMPKATSLMDALYPQAQRFYGYDCVDLAFTRENDRIVVGMTEKEALPSAAEIEESYRHDVHPNGMMIEEGS